MFRRLVELFFDSAGPVAVRFYFIVCIDPMIEDKNGKLYQTLLKAKNGLESDFDAFKSSFAFQLLKKGTLVLIDGATMIAEDWKKLCRMMDWEDEAEKDKKLKEQIKDSRPKSHR